MATYKGINGTAVQNYAGDLPGAVEGQVWYNSTAATFKINTGAVVTAWATGNNMNTGRRDFGSAGAGTQTAALAFGGVAAPVTAVTEAYNGTNWTEVNDLNTARKYLAGCGTQTSALGFAGYHPGAITGATEQYNGTNWTEVNDMSGARYNLAGAGATNTAGLSFGGSPASTNTELWNGTNWTEVNNLNTGRYKPGAAGITTAALAFGGQSAAEPQTAVTEQWNGTNWTEVNDLNTARYGLGQAGTVAAALAFGGSQSPLAQTEEYGETGGNKTIQTS